MSIQLSLVPTPKAEVSSIPEAEPPTEVVFDPADSCDKHTCYNQETGICPKYGYRISPFLAANQRLCDIEDDETEATQ